MFLRMQATMRTAGLARLHLEFSSTLWAILVICLFSAPAIAAAEGDLGADRLDACVHRLLNPSQVAALKGANRGDYVVQLVEGRVQGVARTLVLLGETHVKSKRDYKRGADVVNEFAVVGLEGSNTEDFWLGRATIKLFHAMYALERLFGQAPSTIQYAHELANHYDAMTLVDLEEGHKFTPQEKVGMRRVFVDMGFQAAMSLTQIGSACSLIASVFMLDPWMGGASVAGVALPKIVDSVYGALREREENLERVLCGSRNEAMVDNAMKFLRKHPSVRQMLVIVGMSHVPGMTSYFESRGMRASRLE